MLNFYLGLPKLTFWSKLGMKKQRFLGLSVLAENWSIILCDMMLWHYQTFCFCLRVRFDLTLIRLTSERPWKGWKGAPGAPLSILSLEQIFAKKSCFSKGWNQFQLIWSFFRIFFPKVTKKWEKLKIYQKIAKNEWKFPIL